MARRRASQLFEQKEKTAEKLEDRVDVLRSRAQLLTGKDRLLMQMYLNNANTFSQMARLAGVNEASVSRRIHKLVRRLLDGQFITCLRSRGKLTNEQIEIARDYFVKGVPMRKIAERHKTSYYIVRQTMKKIQRLTMVEQK
jgi:predicted DNA-binding protein YlxM (UPF0122 family)